MPASRPAQPAQQPPPSSVSMGKKPMPHPPQPPQQQQPYPQQQQQQQRSARAASKAPLTYNQGQQQQQQPHNHPHHHPSPPSSNASGPNKTGRQGQGAVAQNATPQKANKIWSTSTTEERERIKDFWLGLGEEERKNLVKIEKDTVLRKMKEQQKHSCSCAVCGRKRNAIEEELEVLYDAYYEELEQYANYQQRYVSSGGTIPPPPGPGPFPGSVELDKNGAVVGHNTRHPAAANTAPPNTKGARQQRGKQQPVQAVNGRKVHPPSQPVIPRHPHIYPQPQHVKESEFEDDEDVGDEDEYEEEEEEEYEEEEEEEDEEDEDGDEDEDDPLRGVDKGRKVNTRGAVPVLPPAPQQQQTKGRRGANGVAPDKISSPGRDTLFNIGTSLTVTGPGNILTVADDLLKNDGQKFLEMMEQLAERRMQREEEAAGDVEDDSDEDEDPRERRRRGDGEDEEDEDEDDEDDDDEDDDDEDDEDEDDEEEEEAMTEEQKMEEGKRMFSIFAARMFEQRVLQAYREKVAQERQLQLLRELEDEDKLSKEREAKKQTQNQKKKDKKRQQKQAKDEERAQKAQEKAAEEAAAKAKQAAMEEENKKKREEERARREANKKAAEEERLRKEEEKRKRVQEEKEREAERERKKREKEERTKAERKEREEKERRLREEKEARLAKEKEERLERERAERERQEKARAEKLEKEQVERAEREKDRKLTKEREEKAEREARERLALQHQKQRVAASPPAAGSSSGKNAKIVPARSATSPRNNAVASGSSSSNVHLPVGVVVNGTTPKKILNKPSQISLTSPTAGQGSRQTPQQLHPIQQPQQSRGPQMVSQPQTPITPHLPTHPPPQTPIMYQQGGPGMLPPSNMSPRVQGFAPMGYGFGSQGMQHPGPPGGLAPSALPRNFSSGPSYDPAYNRGLGIGGLPPSATPIGPPLKSKPSLSSSSASSSGQTMLSLAPGQGRRASLLSGDPGPVARPIAPIARPTVAGGTAEPGSGPGSPIRRSPSPKGVLGSSALVEDGDEVVRTTIGRRNTAPIGIGIGIPIGPGPGSVGAVGQGWGPASPRSAVGDNRAPWGAPSGPPGFGSPRGPPPPVGPMSNHHPQPIGPGSLWGNATPGGLNQDWHPSGNYFPNH
ncbi:salt tolerance down-regulator-domain-containing protein [Collybia nuda]|uniref:Stress response protein NST1 n=1 Tax=Collybia nuda TaxID=64659 RepID=A0A9P5XUR1_9AGAR|nr:salt tolerance down-regulator-domain-containing protein [Collybia nuda]